MPDKQVKTKEISPQRRLFAYEYICGPFAYNATQSAILAEYSKKAAKQQGSYLLTCTDVQQEIARLEEDRQAETDCNRRKCELEYDYARSVACRQANPTAMIAATHGKARLYGLDITKIESDTFAGRRPANANDTIEKSKSRTAKVLESKEVLALPAEELAQATPEGGGGG